MEFSISNKSKAMKRRYRNEKKWRALRIVEKTSYIITVILPILVYALYYNLGMRRVPGFYYIDIYTGEEYLLHPGMWAGCAFSVMLVIVICIKALKFNLTSSRIFSFREERLFEKDGKLYHLYKTQLGGGIDTFSNSSETVVEEVDIDKIQKLLINPKSGRLEFLADTKRTVYANLNSGIIAEEPQIIHKYKNAYYDYFTPSLTEYLKAQRIPWEEQEINYSIRLGE